MAAAPIDVVVSIVVAVSSLTAPATAAAAPPAPAQVSRCEPAASSRWEADAQRLADALAGVTQDDEGVRLRQTLESAGFVPGRPIAEPRPDNAETDGTAPGSGSEGRGDEGDLSELISELVEALAGAAGPDAELIVIGPDGAAASPADRPRSRSGSVEACDNPAGEDPAGDAPAGGS